MNMTLGKPDILLVKEALESIKGREDKMALEKFEEIQRLLDRINFQLSEKEIRSPLGHIWRPM